MEVLLVGSYHMDNPGRDIANMEADDVLAPHRAQQIQAVVAGLVRFGATKVATEGAFDSTATQESYDRYRETGLAGRSEAEQLAFPVAHRLGHRRVYPINIMDDFITEEMSDLVDRDEVCARRWGEMLERGQVWGREETARLAAMTVGQYLRFMNSSQERRRMLAPYMDDFVPLNDGANWAGPDAVANWYRRNPRLPRTSSVSPSPTIGSSSSTEPATSPYSNTSSKRRRV